MSNGYEILGGVVPPYQVLQQQNAGLPPGGVPPWYAMQYPAGYVPPLLVSVDNPLEPDPFNTFELLNRHHDEREMRDLARSHIFGATTYDIANITRAFNGVFYSKRDGKQYYRNVPIVDAKAIAKQAAKAISDAIRIAPTGLFIPTQDTARQTVKGKIDWHVNNINQLEKQLGAKAPYPSSDDLRKWATSAFVEYNSATSAAEYASAKLSFFKEVIDQCALIAHELEKAGNTITNKVDEALQDGVTSIVPWWMWAIGGVALVSIGGYLLLPFIVPALARTAILTTAAKESLRRIKG